MDRLDANGQQTVAAGIDNKIAAKRDEVEGQVTQAFGGDLSAMEGESTNTAQKVDALLDRTHVVGETVATQAVKVQAITDRVTALGNQLVAAGGQMQQAGQALQTQGASMRENGTELDEAEMQKVDNAGFYLHDAGVLLEGH